MSEDGPVTVALLAAICDAFNRHDTDAILSHFADECEWLMARGPEPRFGRRCRGKAEIGAVLRARFAAIPDLRWLDLAHWVAGTRAISEWTVQGTLPSGAGLDFMGCDLWSFRGSLVVRKNTFWKTIETG